MFVGEYVRQEEVEDLADLVDLEGVPYPDGMLRGVRYVYDVDQVFKGEVAADQSVVSEGSGMCGMSGPEMGTTYLMFTTRESTGELTSGLCSGNRPVTTDDPIPAALVTRGSIDSNPSPPGETESASTVASGSSSPSVWWIVGGAAVCLLVAGAAGWRRRRSNRRSGPSSLAR